MTNQEAIEKFKKIKRGSIFLILQRIEGKEVIEDYSLCDMAISALEKQIPKKPRIKLDDYCETLYRMYCPNCNGYLGRGNKRVGYVVRRFENQKYCGECGQLIDWPEEWL